MLKVPEPVSAGIMLSYRCSGECKHCMYACSLEWGGGWISEGDLEKVLKNLSGRIRGPPSEAWYGITADTDVNMEMGGGMGIGINYGIHLTGGEPFLNFDLLLKATRKLKEYRFPSTFVETNSFWCVDERTAMEKLLLLKGAGLHGMLVSVNPFVVEHVPFERIERAVRIGREVFGENVLVYQEYFYNLFSRMELRGTLPFEEYLRLAGIRSLYHVELIPMGRAVYRLQGVLGKLYGRRRAEDFFGESCLEELTRPWHVHIDNYCNYMAGYCGGLSLGDARDLDSICAGVNLEERPVLGALVEDIRTLYEMGVEEFGYRELEEGYVSKCHLCLDLRRHIVKKTARFKELSPREFYDHL